MAFLHEVTFMLFFPRTAVCFSTKSETHIEVCFPVQHKAMILGKPNSDIFFFIFKSQNTDAIFPHVLLHCVECSVFPLHNSVCLWDHLRSHVTGTIKCQVSGE